MPWLWPFGQNDASSNSQRSSSNETQSAGALDSDTLLLMIFIAGLVAIWIYYTRRHQRTTIHPDNQQDVEFLRQRSQEQADTTASAPPFPQSDRSRRDMCPICLEEPAVFSVETNCGHVFCGKCLVQFWKFQANWMSGLKCPVCRQNVTVMLECFTAAERAASNNIDRQQVTNGVREFNRRFSSVPRTWLEYFYDIPVLIPYIIRQLFSADGLRWTYRLRTILILLATVAYVLSPFDILPESLLGIVGLLDDFLVVLGAALVAIVSFRQHLAQA